VSPAGDALERLESGEELYYLYSRVTPVVRLRIQVFLSRKGLLS
jgi:hypothetical protein